MADRSADNFGIPTPYTYAPTKKAPLHERIMNLSAKLFAVMVVTLGLSVFTIFAVGIVGLCLKWTIGWFKP